LNVEPLNPEADVKPDTIVIATIVTFFWDMILGIEHADFGFIAGFKLQSWYENRIIKLFDQIGGKMEEYYG
jgi:hypothetical protein